MGRREHHFVVAESMAFVQVWKLVITRTVVYNTILLLLAHVGHITSHSCYFELLLPLS